MQATGSLGSTLRFLGVGLVIVAVAACQDPGENCAAACPEPVDGWASRQLTVDEMRAILADWTPERAVAAQAACVPEGHSDRACPDVPVGVDPRVGLPVYLRWHCDDVCPDYAKFLIAYGPEHFGNEDCEEIGMCYVQAGASPGTHLECLPIYIYYGGCHSQALCDWNGICEPARGETPDACPKECTP